MTKKLTQDCIKTIYTLTKNENYASNEKITQKLNLTTTNLTEILQELTQEGHINYSPTNGSTLTQKGLREAQKITSNRYRLTKFLNHTIHNKNKNDKTQPQTPPQSSSNPPACSNNSANCVLSNCENCLKQHPQGFEEIGKHNKNLTSLYELKAGKTAKISSIRGERKILQRLLDLGLTPGTQIKVAKIAPMGGPVEILVRGSKLALGQNIAINIFVETPKETPPPNEV
ncbi:MAG: FeoA domain-containing protein [Nitrososphaerota archaeon]|jgi:DtxR family Mn-dependent transcriptional regulator|nr:FeoA domain-containing protein [Nitrososphaerota archaeon]